MRELLPAVFPLSLAGLAFVAALARSYWLAGMGLREDFQGFIVTALWIIGGMALLAAAVMISRSRS
jgi:hypothetical protein